MLHSAGVPGRIARYDYARAFYHHGLTEQLLASDGLQPDLNEILREAGAHPLGDRVRIIASLRRKKTSQPQKIGTSWCLSTGKDCA